MWRVAEISVVNVATGVVATLHDTLPQPGQPTWSAGGTRLVQRTEGFDATIVSGEVVYRNGAATGALPGRLVRG